MTHEWRHERKDTMEPATSKNMIVVVERKGLLNHGTWLKRKSLKIRLLEAWMEERGTKSIEVYPNIFHRELWIEKMFLKLFVPFPGSITWKRNRFSAAKNSLLSFSCELSWNIPREILLLNITYKSRSSRRRERFLHGQLKKNNQFKNPFFCCFSCTKFYLFDPLKPGPKHSFTFITKKCPYLFQDVSDLI